MHAVFTSLPLAAAFLAVPQFLPQLSRVRAGTTAGVSWSWAALTSVNNAAWLGYFALSGFWTALVPAISATVLSGHLAIVLARRGGLPRRPAVFLLQVTPSVWTVYRSKDTTCVSRGTWLLIFGELLCWGVFGIHEADPRLIVLGATGVVASLLVLARVSWPAGRAALATGSASASLVLAATVVSPSMGGAEGCSRQRVVRNPECVEGRLKSRQPEMEGPALL